MITDNIVITKITLNSPCYRSDNSVTIKKDCR